MLDDIEQGKLRLLYLTPEMLQNTKVQQALLAADIAGVMVDEAHCVYKQGPGFREAYLKIADFVGKLPHRPPVGAFTATATQTTAQYIAKHLGMDDPVVIRGPVTRDNITLRVFPISEELGGIKDADLIEYHKREIIRKRLKHTTDGRVIIYTNTIKRVKALYKHLRKHGFAVGYYHGKCDDKAKRLRRFREGQTRIMVATMRSVWASTSRISGWSSTTRRSSGWTTTCKRSAAPGAMAKRPKPCSSGIPTISQSTASSSGKTSST